MANTNRDYEMMYMASTQSKAYKSWAKEQDDCEIIISVNIASLNSAILSLVYSMNESDLKFFCKEIESCDENSKRQYLIDLLTDSLTFDQQVKTDVGDMSAGDVFDKYFNHSDTAIISENLDYAPAFLLCEMQAKLGGVR